MDISGMRVAVIGASLGGLAAANALSRLGADITVFERGDSTPACRGGGLGVDLQLAKTLTGASSGPPHLVLLRRREWAPHTELVGPSSLTVTSYASLWRWLRAPLRSTRLEFGRNVVLVEPSGQPRVSTADARVHAFDLVVAADGGTSALRDTHLGARSSYAGYVLWRGLVAITALAEPASFRDTFHVGARSRDHFVAYPIPSRGGAVDPGAQLLNWGWYRPMTEQAVRAELRDIVRSPHRLRRDSHTIGVFARLWHEQGWPAWVSHIVRATAECGSIGPHPVYQCLPRTIVRRQLAFMGDAAHLASPLTGSGAAMAMEDALVLSRSLVAARDIAAALQLYCEQRLGRAREVVRYGTARGWALIQR